MGKLMSCSYQLDESMITDIKPINDSFALGTLYIMYTGKNPNKTNFSREAVEDALPTLRNTPIVCHWNPDEETIGGHDFTVVSNGNGELRLRALTEPCGVVTESSVLSFVTMEDSAGEEHEYLKAENVVLWRRQDVVQHIEANKDVHLDHSMEIDVLDGEDMGDGYYDVKSFQFTALCLLGNCRPCFDGSRLELYSSEDLKGQIAAMMEDIKANYSLIVAAANGDGDDNTEESLKGGEGNMENENIENVATQVEPVGEPEPVVTEPEATAEEPIVEDGDAECAASTAAQTDYSLASNMADVLFAAVSEPKTETRWGEESLYWMVDYDTEKGFVYAECWCDGKLYGFPYKMDGDNVVIDFEAKTRKKWEIVDFDEGDSTNADYYSESVEAHGKAITEYVDATATELDTLKSSVSTFEAKISEMETELTELRQYKADVEAQKIEAEHEELFARFADLDGVEAFEALRENSADMSVESLEEKCFAIRGRLATVANGTTTYAAKTCKPKIGLDKTEADDSESETKPYGGIVERYTTK